MNLKDPSLDFRFFLNHIVNDSKVIAEKGHLTGAFTAVGTVLALSYQTITGVDPFNILSPISPDKVLIWAVDVVGILPKFKPCFEPSEDLVQIIQIMAVALAKAINLSGSSFSFIIGMVACLGRAYYVVNGIDILANTRHEESYKKLIMWAWSFRVVERETKVERLSNGT